MRTFASLVLFSAITSSAFAGAWKPVVVPVLMPKPGIVHQMWTPKPVTVFMDIPIERIAKEHKVERLGYKFYRRVR
jgi:hypothetical protein